MLDFRTDTFLCVCKYRNFTRAAEELNLTQPCVSQHIRYLEKYYSVKLFSYDNKTLRLTEPGEKIYNALLSFRHDEIHLKESVRSSGRQAEKLKFGATLSIGEYCLPDKLARFLQHGGPAEVELTVSDTRDLLSRLDSGAIDFALIEGFFKKTDYDCIRIQKEELVAVRGADYPLGNVGSVADLFDCHLITREPGSGTREVLERYLTENGYSISRFSRRSTVNDLPVILKLLERNLGIGFLYRSVVEKEIQSGRLVPIEIPDCRISHEFNFIWRKSSIFSDRYRSLFRRLLKDETD